MAHSEDDTANKATKSGLRPGRHSKAPHASGVPSRRLPSRCGGRGRRSWRSGLVPLRPPLLRTCVLVSSYKDPSRVGSGAAPGTSLNRRADLSPPSTTPFRGPAGRQSGLHTWIGGTPVSPYWSLSEVLGGQEFGGHSLALHGGCGVNSVLSKDQGGCGGEGGQVTQRVPAVHRSAVHRTWDQPSHSAKI